MDSSDFADPLSSGRFPQTNLYLVVTYWFAALLWRAGWSNIRWTNGGAVIMTGILLWDATSFLWSSISAISLWNSLPSGSSIIQASNVPASFDRISYGNNGYGLPGIDPERRYFGPNIWTKSIWICKLSRSHWCLDGLEWFPVDIAIVVRIIMSYVHSAQTTIRVLW